MPDDFDFAQQVEQSAREAAIARVRAEARRIHMPAASIFCACGDEIPEERRKALPGATRCIDCQTRQDRRARTSR